MFFDIGWSELLLIGVVALVVIGPKDLPRALRVAGYWVRKARTLSREFQSSVEQMIREAELDEMRQELKKATEFDIEKEFRNTVDPDGKLTESIRPPDIPDYFEPASTDPSPTTPAELPTSAEAVESTSADAAATVAEPRTALEPADIPEQPALPFDIREPAGEPADKVAVAREPEGPKA